MVMKILIADARPEVRSALRLILTRIPAVRAVSEAGSLIQLLTQCAQECPDLILCDLEFDRPSRTQSPTSLVSVIRRLCPCARIVVMSSRFETQQEALAAGASGFISKTDAPDEVLTTIVRFLESHA